MTKPGQKTALQKSVTAITSVQRKAPPPPAGLSELESGIWRSTVDVMDPTWFKPEVWPLLKSYCRHTAYAERLAPMVDRALEDVDAIGIADPEVVKAADKIVAMHEKQVRAASSLATRLRITLQATRTADQTKPNLPERKPWERKS